MISGFIVALAVRRIDGHEVDGPRARPPPAAKELLLCVVAGFVGRRRALQALEPLPLMRQHHRRLKVSATDTRGIDVVRIGVGG